MRIETDKDYVYHLWDSPGEVINTVQSSQMGHEMFSDYYGRWSGRAFSNFEDIKSQARLPWQEGLNTVQEMAKEISSAIPEPRSRKRKARWNEDDGEVCTDRLLNADPDFFRLTKRDFHTGMSNIALVSNIGANCHVKHTDLFWRGATLVALIDLLEKASYNCEAWVWWHTTHLWHNGIPNNFTAIKLKEAGDPLDIGPLTNAVSSWFFRTIMFAECEIGIGEKETRKVSSNYGRSNHTLLPKHREKMDITENILEMHISPDAFSKDKAITSAKEILKKIENQ